MMKKQLFLAIPLSESMMDKLAALKDRYDMESDVHWTKKQNLHITIYFFGDVEETKIPEMSKKIIQVVSTTPKFNLDFEKILFAPPNRPPRMVWADFGHCEAYVKLCREIYVAIKEFLDPKSAQEPGRDPHPHITLARFNNPAVVKSLRLETIQQETMPVDGCKLIASELTPNGSVYTVLEHYAFS